MVSYLLADNGLICRLHAAAMHEFREQCQIGPIRRCICRYFKTMYNKTIIRFDFCDIRSNQGLGNKVEADNIYLDLDYFGYHKNLIQQLFKSIVLFTFK